MTITTQKTVGDPYGPMAWNVSLTLLGLKKVKKGVELNMNEVKAINEITESISLLHKTSLLPANELLNGSLHSSSHLHLSPIAITLYSSPNQISTATLEEAEGILSNIRDYLKKNKSSEVEHSLIEKARDFCRKLLENLNSHRPTHYEYSALAGTI